MGDTALGYDANGNTLVECHAGPSEVCAGTPGTTGAVSTAKLRRFAWNEENWLKAVVDGGGQNVTRFLYDAGGERVVKMGQSGVSITVGQFFAVKNGIYATKHIFAGETRLVSKLEPLRRNIEPDDDGTPGEVQDLPGCEPSDYTPRKCYAPIVGIAADGSSSPANFRPMTYYYHPDHLGSTSWLTDQYGEVEERVEYYPYGEVWREDREQRRGNLRRIQQFLFTSKEFDEETELTYFGGRYYESNHARWLTVDPSLATADHAPPFLLSGYLYSHASPIAWKDPDGKCDFNVTSGVNCLAYAGDVEAEMRANIKGAWNAGEYGWVAADAGFYAFGVSTYYATGWANQLLLGGPFNAGYGAASGFKTGNYRQALLGSLELLTLGVAGLAGQLALQPSRAFAREAAEVLRAPSAAEVGPRLFSSGDPLVADLANKIEAAYPGHVVGVNVPVFNAAGQLVTDLDILLRNAVLQVKSGSGTGLTRQVLTSQQVTGLPGIGYGPNLGPSVVRGINKAGGLATTDAQLLLEVVAP